MSTHSIILAFANDREKFLPDLHREAIILENTLANAKIGAGIVSMEMANINNVFTELEREKDNILIFHYGGHAGGLDLMLEGEIANGKGFAKVLEGSKTIKLVFLNGCATVELVKHFHEAGVPIVIATSAPVNDTSAVDFAIKFYSVLTTYYTIAKAFKFAKDYISTVSKYKYRFSKDRSRHIGVNKSNVSQENYLEWGIYINPHRDKAEETLTWTLPNNTIYPQPEYYNENRKLVKNIGETCKNLVEGYLAKVQAGSEEEKSAVIKYADLLEVKSAYLKYKETEDDNVFRFLTGKILQVLPYPIGVELRRIGTLDGLGLTENNRLRQLLMHQIRLYTTMMKLCGFALLSCLWDIIDKGVQIKIAEGQKQYLMNFFNGAEQNKDELEETEHDQDECDYAYLIRAVRDILTENSLIPFIAEYDNLKGSFEKEDDFYEAHIFIQAIKAKLYKNDIESSKYASLCQQTEDKLCIAFKRLFFILNYKLVVIKEIQILKYRNEARLFQHRRVALDRTYDFLVDEDYDDAVNHTDSYSVILVRTMNDYQSYLSLSPCIIDHNALNGNEKSNLFFFHHADGDNFVFECIDSDRPHTGLIINENSVELIKNPLYKDESEHGGNIQMSYRSPQTKRRINKRFLIIRSQLLDFRKKIENMQTK